MAIQYSSNHPHKCSLASSKVFSCKMMSHISKGHWDSFSAATNCTFMCRVCDLPRDLIRRCITLGDEICKEVIIKIPSIVPKKGHQARPGAKYYLQMDHNRVETGFEQLGRMVDGVAIQDDQLECLGKLEDAFDFVLNVSHRGIRSRTGRV